MYILNRFFDGFSHFLLIAGLSLTKDEDGFPTEIGWRIESRFTIYLIIKVDCKNQFFFLTKFQPWTFFSNENEFSMCEFLLYCCVEFG